MTTFKSGSSGRTTFGSYELAITGWNAVFSVDHQEFRNSKTGKFTVIDPNFFPPVPITIDADFDLDQNPFAATPNITPGAFLANTKLYVAGGDGASPAGEAFTFPSAMVKSVEVGTVIEGKITFRIQLMSSGDYTFPGDASPADNITANVYDPA